MISLNEVGFDITRLLVRNLLERLRRILFGEDQVWMIRDSRTLA